MNYVELINSVFLLADFVFKKIEDSKALENKNKEELIAYFESKFGEINSKLKKLHH